ncbi:Cobalt ABC superfamily ATP binding cassette transporter, membrane protein [Alteracholeplasma palmae J233]|uniref:Cobalt ABC superfamily ATP binding cassette transporter, membrane protein n=1 Tax=Alteracholeplasma palmae (strain ATCC 49389 / J233) TaxID=1318466 RepID=U4KSB4_ALTPJ|nr:energy-coupling factor transporter transmembrane component T [Alteracholeplasma palmae]CCV64891.1 Cobalt ABC superfamily ATP binding cassette transporter, membrane protein [Alteracholeplasma palmae J233]
MNNIKIGQYLPGNSLLHRMIPSVKIISMILLMVSIFLIPIELKMINLILLGSLFIFALLLVFISSVPFKNVMNNLKGIVFLLVFTSIIQVFYIQTGTLWLETDMSFGLASFGAIIGLIIFYNFTKKYIKFRTIYFLITVVLIFVLQAYLPYMPWANYKLAIYSDAVIRVLFIFVRIMTVIIIASLLTYTTSTTELNDGLETVLKPLKYIGVPVSIFAMMLSLTLRSIPTLLEETEKIMKAQASRGVEFKESKFIQKLGQIISLLVPIFVISFKRSLDLSNAMEVRGYVLGAPRTKLASYRWASKDILALIVSLSVLIGIICFRIVAAYVSF